MRNRYSRLLSGILKWRDHSEDVGLEGRIMLEWFLRKYGGKVWIGHIWLKIGTSSGLL
jgi:hypothetical protein